LLLEVEKEKERERGLNRQRGLLSRFVYEQSWSCRALYQARRGGLFDELTALDVLVREEA
jgi:hypothetical protein